jgi:hypothetical protein
MISHEWSKLNRCHDHGEVVDLGAYVITVGDLVNKRILFEHY